MPVELGWYKSINCYWDIGICEIVCDNWYLYSKYRRHAQSDHVLSLWYKYVYRYLLFGWHLKSQRGQRFADKFRIYLSQTWFQTLQCHIQVKMFILPSSTEFFGCHSQVMIRRYTRNQVSIYIRKGFDTRTYVILHNRKQGLSRAKPY